MTVVQDIIQSHFVSKAAAMDIISAKPTVNQLIGVDWREIRYHIVITSILIFFCKKLMISQFCSFAVVTRSKIFSFKTGFSATSTAGFDGSAFFFFGADLGGEI